MHNLIQIPDEVIISRIYLIRDQKVMIDRDLADLFGVETKRLKEAVRRNLRRFPSDFMFEMNVRELEQWRRDHLQENDDKLGLRHAPYCFTEQGVTMLSCVLNSDVAIEMNIRIIRVFTRMRDMIQHHSDILLKLKELEEGVINNNEQIQILFEAIKQLLHKPQAATRPIGFINGVSKQ
jgi:hypothetical protein